MRDPKALSVTRLVRRMRNLLEIELGELWVEGEVSNLHRQSNGHIYFTLKDEGAQINCVLFKGNARVSIVQPDNGMQVRLFGEVSVYEARGSVQLIVRKVELAGEGELQARFESLKRKLQGEGLFDEENKKPLPSFPKSVGLITSGTGAALQDILNVLSRRAPWVKPVLYPVQVQGVGAEYGISEAITKWSDWENTGLPEVDVIIVGRGGGSFEDLWNFNEEVVARAIADCQIPIVSAVGHEIDFTISDFVADMRVPTPSAAAELVVPDGDALSSRVTRMKSQILRMVQTDFQRYELILQSMKRGVLSQSADRMLREPLQRLIQIRRELDNGVVYSVNHGDSHLEQLFVRLGTQLPEKVLERCLEQLGKMSLLLDKAVIDQIERHSLNLSQLSSMLRTLGPESAFNRGFSVTLSEDGKMIKDPENVKLGQRLVTKLKGGEVKSVAE